MLSIHKIIQALDGIEREEVTIFCQKETICENLARHEHDRRFLIVRDTLPERAMKIAKALSDELGIYIEVEVLAGGFPRRK